MGIIFSLVERPFSAFDSSSNWGFLTIEYERSLSRTILLFSIRLLELVDSRRGRGPPFGVWPYGVTLCLGFDP